MRPRASRGAWRDGRLGRGCVLSPENDEPSELVRQKVPPREDGLDVKAVEPVPVTVRLVSD